jgi:hypothetical protein
LSRHATINAFTLDKNVRVDMEGNLKELERQVGHALKGKGRDIFESYLKRVMQNYKLQGRF